MDAHHLTTTEGMGHHLTDLLPSSVPGMAKGLHSCYKFVFLTVLEVKVSKSWESNLLVGGESPEWRDTPQGLGLPRRAQHLEEEVQRVKSALG